MFETVSPVITEVLEAGTVYTVSAEGAEEGLPTNALNLLNVAINQKQEYR